MKKRLVLLLLVVAIIVITCVVLSNKESTLTDPEESKQIPKRRSETFMVDNEPVDFDPDFHIDINWDDPLVYDGPVVPDKETAVRIAKAVFEGMEKPTDFINHKPQSVVYNEEDEVWIVGFWETTDMPKLGGDCSIAIQKSDGKVVRIWFGE